MELVGKWLVKSTYQLKNANSQRILINPPIVERKQPLDPDEVVDVLRSPVRISYTQ